MATDIEFIARIRDGVSFDDLTVSDLREIAKMIRDGDLRHVDDWMMACPVRGNSVVRAAG